MADLMRISAIVITLTMLTQPVVSEPVIEAGSHCAFHNQERDWGNSKFGSAYAAIDVANAFCEPGDHLAIFNMRTFEASYFIAYFCNPAFAINVIPFNENRSAVTCVFAGEKLDRFETCAHSTTASC